MSALIDPAELVVSELVTNAVQHGIPAAPDLAPGQCVRLRLLAHGPFVMSMVNDPGRASPVVQEPDPDGETGHGLKVVGACCVRWGWYPLEEGGKVVWALMR
jgi:hypothetical protein